jgi:hypothetical protein
MAIRTLLFCSSFFFLVWTAQSQQRQDLWAMFKRVPFKEKLNQNFNLYFFYPEFTQELKALKGKREEIQNDQNSSDLIFPNINEWFVLNICILVSYRFCSSANILAETII